MLRTWSKVAVCITLLLSIPVLADSGRAPLKATTLTHEHASHDAARLLVINTGILLVTIRGIALTQVMQQGMNELATGLAKGTKDARDAKTRLNKEIDESIRKIIRETNQYRAEIEQQSSGEEPDLQLQRLMEVEHWAKANAYLAKIPKYHNKSLPDLRTRLDDAAFEQWIKAMMSPPKGKNGKVKQNAVLDALRELHAYLNDLDPQVVAQRAQETRQQELLTAIRADDLNRVKTLIAEGAVVESSNSHAIADEVPLLVAVAMAGPEMVTLLRQHGAGETAEQLVRAFGVAINQRPSLFPVLLNGAKFPNEDNLNKVLSDFTHDLIREQHYAELALLLPSIGNVDHLTRFDRPLLYEAIDEGNIEAAALLLKHGANPNAIVKVWGPLFGVAIGKKNPQMVQLLLSHGANPNPVPDKNGQTLLGDLLDTSFDLNADQLLIADKLVAAGAQLSVDNGAEACRIVIRHAERIGKPVVALAEQFHIDARHSSATDLGCLWEAVAQNELVLAEWALKQGAVATARNKEGATLLHHLVRSSHTLAPTLIRQVVQAGVDPNDVNVNDDTPLHLAASHNSEAIAILLELGANPNLYNAQNYLAFEKLMPNEKGLPWAEEFIQHGQDMDAVLSRGQTVFASFASEASIPQLQWFFSVPRKFDINAPDDAGDTPLANLLLNNKLDAARIVYKHGANIDQGDLQGHTPLHYAASYGRMELLPIILDEMHANPNVICYHGHNVMDFARSAPDVQVEQWLKSRVTGPFADAAAMLEARYENNRRYLAISRQRKHLTTTGMVNIGLIYEHGNGVPLDYTEAMSWYRKAAQLGDAQAQFNIALLYQEGKGVKQDQSEAIAWYRKAAEQDYAAAQNNLATMYNDGHGVKQDHVEALGWFQKAAEQGLAIAQSNLAAMYANGTGTKKNKTKAIQWYKKAAEQGHETAIEALKNLTRKTKVKSPAATN